MKKKRFTEAQIAYALAQESTGETIAEICRRHRVSEQTFYRRKRKFGSMGVPELRRLKQVEEENAKLKRLVADLSLDKAILQDVLQKKVEDPTSDERWSSMRAMRIGSPSDVRVGCSALRAGRIATPP